MNSLRIFMGLLVCVFCFTCQVPSAYAEGYGGSSGARQHLPQAAKDTASDHNKIRHRPKIIRNEKEDGRTRFYVDGKAIGYFENGILYVSEGVKVQPIRMEP